MLNPREKMVVIDGQIKTANILHISTNNRMNGYDIVFNKTTRKTSHTVTTGQCGSLILLFLTRNIAISITTVGNYGHWLILPHSSEVTLNTGM